MAISSGYANSLMIVLIFIIFQFTTMKSQLLSLSGIPFGCGSFQYYNTSFGMKNPPEIIQNALDEVDAYLDYLFTITGVPSLSFGIVYDQELIYYKSSGVTNLKTLQKPTADSIYRIASISKVFTVLMAYIMRDNHDQISFDDPIYKFNPKFSIHNLWGVTPEERFGQTLTVKQLASQISGLPREPPCDWEAGDCINITTADIFARLSKQYLIHPTDVQASYSNLAYAILGNVLSEFNGDNSYNHTLFDLVINPLWLKNTGLYLNAAQKPYAATGYNVSGVEQEYIDIGWVAPAGQLFSSVRDLSLLLKQFFAAYPSLYQQQLGAYDFSASPQTLREMLRPVFINPDGQSGFGSPWEMQMVDGHFIRSKAGNINGFSSSIGLIPEMKLGVIALSNYQLDESLFTFGTLEILLPAFKSWINSMKATTFKPHLPSDVSEYVGTYYMTESLPLFTVYVHNKTQHLMLSSNINGFYGVLTWIEGNLFVYNDLFDNTESCWTKTLGAADGISIGFVTDESGKVTGATMDGLTFGEIFPKYKGYQNDGRYKSFLRYRKRKQSECNKIWTRDSSKVHLGPNYK